MWQWGRMPRRLENLGRLLARRRWNAEDARAVLKHLDASGMSVREFAGRHTVDAQRLNRWRAQLMSVSRELATAFVEIRGSTTAAIEVALRSGHVVRVPDGFADETLRRVMAVLDGEADQC
jgi:transposase-like protein